MSSPDLIEVARALADAGRGRPTQARLRRAVSTAYYAMFHSLATTAADLFIGRVRGPAWHRTYRALEHGRAKNACQQARAMREFPAAVQSFARSFVMVQKARHQADYSLDTDPYRKSEVLAYIASAEAAIHGLEQVDVSSRRAFAAHVLFRQRQP